VNAGVDRAWIRAPTTLHLEDLWIKNITITTGLVDGTTVPLLLQLVRSGKIAADLFGTHDFALHDMMAAYDTFANAGKHNATPCYPSSMISPNRGKFPRFRVQVPPRTQSNLL
jgi:threonine dehydrogenase-like Zn-dependent dehydrogenase